MSYTHHRVIFLFLYFVLTQHAIQADNDPIVVEFFNKLSIKEESDEKNNNQQSLHNKKQYNFSEAEIEEMKLVMHYAPLDARLIINHLQDSTFFPNNEDYRSVLFVGEPGSGKTIMAKAIAYHMALDGWEYKFIPSTFFLGEYRNQTAIKL